MPKTKGYKLKLFFAEKPTIDLSGIKDITVKAGQDFEIKIPFTGVPKPTATWARDSEPVKENSHITMKVRNWEILNLMPKFWQSFRI